MALYFDGRKMKINTEGYIVGYSDGKAQERHNFWESFQENGKRTVYTYAFWSNWDDSIYNPIYSIVCTGNKIAIDNMFGYSSITDTKVDIIVNTPCTASTFAFRYASNLKTIRKLIVTEDVTFSSWFVGCSALENITFEGTIGKNIDLSGSPLLTHESLTNIIEHLKDYSGTSTTCTLTIGVTNQAKLTDIEKAIATEKGWTIA